MAPSQVQTRELRKYHKDIIDVLTSMKNGKLSSMTVTFIFQIAKQASLETEKTAPTIRKSPSVPIDLWISAE